MSILSGRPDQDLVHDRDEFEVLAPERGSVESRSQRGLRLRAVFPMLVRACVRRRDRDENDQHNLSDEGSWSPERSISMSLRE